MSEYIVQRDTMVAIADPVRELSGETGELTPAQIATEVTEANIEVDSQAELIAQLNAALDGKSVEGGVGVETCTVNIVADKTSYVNGYNYLENGEMKVGSTSGTSIVLENLVCNSVLAVESSYDWMTFYRQYDGTLEAVQDSSDNGLAIFKAPSVSGEIATITLSGEEL